MATPIATKRIAIVTGASSGIGRATAIALAKAGWQLVLTARREHELEETARLCDSNPQAECIVGDITDEQFVTHLFEATFAVHGRVDLLFNNAGTNAPNVPIDELDVSDFENVIKTNLLGPFLCTRQAFRVMKKQSPTGGRIINNGSLSAYVPRPDSSPYTSSKHAILGLTKSTALDGRAFNIACTQIDIGNAHTEMASRLAEGAMQPDGRVIPEATMDPRHVADAIVHIASLPLDVSVLTFNIMATKAPFVGRG